MINTANRSEVKGDRDGGSVIMDMTPFFRVII